MSLPYFPMYPTDFEAKTSHLTLAEDGAYNRLLRICWMTPGCSIPDDPAWIMRRLRVDQDAFDAVVSVVIDEFFTSKSGRLSNAKLSRIFTETNEAHQKRVSAGSKGGKAKALKANDKTSSNAVAKPKQPEPEPEPENTHAIACGPADAVPSWEELTSILLVSGKSQKACRSILGKWCKSHGRDHVASVVVQSIGSADPVSYVEASLAEKKTGGASVAELFKLSDERRKKYET